MATTPTPPPAPRVAGVWRGRVEIADDFDDFDEADARDWYGGEGPAGRAGPAVAPGPPSLQQ